VAVVVVTVLTLQDLVVQVVAAQEEQTVLEAMEQSIQVVEVAVQGVTTFLMQAAQVAQALSFFLCQPQVILA
jgi:hypothetical protein